VSIDTKTLPMQGEAETWDVEGVAAPRYIPAWVLPQADLDNMMAAGAGAAPDIIYARGLSVDPSPDPTSFDRNDCALILFKIGFCRDLGCQDKLTKKIEKYHPLPCALHQYWGHVDLVCIPIGHGGISIQDTATDIATASPRPGSPSTTKTNQKNSRHKKQARRLSPTTNKSQGPS